MTMDGLDHIFRKVGLELRILLGDVDLWLSRMSLADKVLSICIFALVLMVLIMRKPKDYQEGGGMWRQFAMAMMIVVLFGLGITWFVDPSMRAL